LKRGYKEEKSSLENLDNYQAMVKRGNNKKEGMLDADDLERANLTGEEKRDESKQCCTKKLIGLTILKGLKEHL